jgi:hypothetical protein
VTDWARYSPPAARARRAVAPARRAAVPQDWAGVPQDSAAVPQDWAGVPQDSAGVPQDSAAVPQDSAGVPRDSAAVPRDSAGVPRDSAAVPAPSSGTVPDRSSGSAPLGSLGWWRERAWWPRKAGTGSTAGGRASVSKPRRWAPTGAPVRWVPPVPTRRTAGPGRSTPGLPGRGPPPRRGDTAADEGWTAADGVRCCAPTVVETSRMPPSSESKVRIRTIQEPPATTLEG